MRLSGKKSLFKALALTVLGVLATAGSLAANKTLTIRGSNVDTGDTIAIPESAEVSVAATADGITITLPDLDVRLRCLGDVTEDGYCYLAAEGTGSAELVDTDGDNVPDSLDECANTPSNANPINNKGCPDTDGDGYFDNEDSCPTEGGNVDSTGCPIVTPATYTVTPSAGTGGSISPSSRQTVNEGATVTFTVTANAGYSIDSVGGSCGGTLSGTRYTTAAVNSNCTVVASFDEDTTQTGTYCSGGSSLVSCDAAVNLDVWWLKQGFYDLPTPVTIPARKILSMPFTTRTSSDDKGVINLSGLSATPEFQSVDPYRFRAWFSEVPGGAKLSDAKCELVALVPYEVNMEWNQGNPSRFSCDLGTTERVLYLNFEARCIPEHSSCTDPELRFPEKYYLRLIAQ